MKPLGSPENMQERLAETALAGAPFLVGEALRYGPAVPGAASPSYQGVESKSYWVAEAEGTEPTFFLKVAERETAALVDVPTAFEAAQTLASLGLAPEPLHLAKDESAILFRRLSPSWRPATLDRFRDRESMASVIETLGRIGEGKSMGRDWSVFEGIADMRARLGPEADTLPEGAWWLFESVAAIGEAFAAAGTERRPAHADPHASNILFDPQGAVRLVDFDMACDTDPHYQLGAFLNEACQFESEMKAGIGDGGGGLQREHLQPMLRLCGGR